MTIRHSLLALLADEPAHGYGLKNHFEESTAATWPLNVGQVYTTLARLERDGLVSPEEQDNDSQKVWHITDKGRASLASWYAKPVIAEPPARDELAIKVLLTVAADKGDVSEVLHLQRVATMELLQGYTKQKREADPEKQLPWLLLLDALVLKAEAELKWIDLCEERLKQRKES